MIAARRFFLLFMSDYSRLLKLFQQLEPLQKETELVAKGLDAAALNETRNATYHLLIALNDVAKCEKEIEKAESHAKRAIYDCHEEILLNELEKFKVFKEDYKDVVITDVIPSYIDNCRSAASAMNKITAIRSLDAQHVKDCEVKYSPDRNKQYEDIAPFLKIIKDNNFDFELARPELNKLIIKENKGRRTALWIFLATILVALIAWWFPRTPT